MAAVRAPRRSETIVLPASDGRLQIGGVQISSLSSRQAEQGACSQYWWKCYQCLWTHGEDTDASTQSLPPENGRCRRISTTAYHAGDWAATRGVPPKGSGAGRTPVRPWLRRRRGRRVGVGCAAPSGKSRGCCVSLVFGTFYSAHFQMRRKGVVGDRSGSRCRLCAAEGNPPLRNPEFNSAGNTVCGRACGTGLPHGRRFVLPASLTGQGASFRTLLCRSSRAEQGRPEPIRVITKLDHATVPLLRNRSRWG